MSVDSTFNDLGISARLDSFVELLQDELTGTRNVTIEDILIHPYIWEDLY